MSELNQLSVDSITVNMVVRIKSPKYTAKGTRPDLGDPLQISIEQVKKMINNQDFVAEYIPAVFTDNSRGTLLITEKVQS